MRRHGKREICARNLECSPDAVRRRAELKLSTYQVPMRLTEISAEQYRERVAQACEFLEGRSRG
jgi:excinuclease UvrABC nuclease subunit